MYKLELQLKSIYRNELEIYDLELPFAALYMQYFMQKAVTVQPIWPTLRVVNTESVGSFDHTTNRLFNIVKRLPNVQAVSTYKLTCNHGNWPNWIIPIHYNDEAQI